MNSSYTSRRALLNRFVGSAAGAIAGSILLKPAALAQSTGASELSAPETRRVTDVIDGNGLHLDGGEEMHLLAIEAPALEKNGFAELASAGRAALAAAIGNQPITLRYDAIRRDRYGRRLAHAFTADGLWLQAELVKEGLARVHGDSRNRYGLRKLMAIEADARAQKSGIWRHSAFVVRSGTDAALETLSGSFQLVEGKVVESAIAKGMGYLNFGPDHATDLTLVLNKPALAAAEAATIDVAGLAGKRIRCRGWIESFDGPRIEATYPEQIEALEN
ncbi:MAG TPA: thermonuclease family protein [Dongiaceae bacterium]